MMRLMMAWMPSCREVVSTLSGDGLSAASWGRRLLLRLHLWRCEFCARFSRQPSRSREALEASWVKPSGEDVDALMRRVLERLRSP